MAALYAAASEKSQSCDESQHPKALVPPSAATAAIAAATAAATAAIAATAATTTRATAAAATTTTLGALFGFVDAEGTAVEERAVHSLGRASRFGGRAPATPASASASARGARSRSRRSVPCSNR